MTNTTNQIGFELRRDSSSTPKNRPDKADSTSTPKNNIPINVSPSPSTKVKQYNDANFKRKKSTHLSQNQLLLNSFTNQNQSPKFAKRNTTCYTPMKFPQSSSSSNFNLILSPTPTNHERKNSIYDLNNKSTSTYNPDVTNNNNHNNITSKPESKSSNIRVIIRFRPFNQMESDLISSGIGTRTLQVIDDQSFILKNDKVEHSFKFDKIYNDGDQEKLYNYVGKETIQDVINGYNGTIFTYGQSGSGKTYSMFGDNIFNNESKGIIPRTM